MTWGTKGDDKPDPLKKVTVSGDGKSTDEPSFNDHDLDTLYDSALAKFSTEFVEEPKKKNVADEELNYNKAFRSYVVLAWMFCNAALVAVVLKAGGLHRLSVTAPAGRYVSASLLLLLFLTSGFPFSLWMRTGMLIFE